MRRPFYAHATACAFLLVAAVLLLQRPASFVGLTLDAAAGAACCTLLARVAYRRLVREANGGRPMVGNPRRSLPSFLPF